jgi:acylphosphatase
VTGVLKHLPDRNIEIIAEGEKIILEKFLNELRYGEGASRIREIKTTYSDATGGYRGFLVR